MAANFTFTNSMNTSSGVIDVKYSFDGLDFKKKEVIEKFNNFRFEFGEIARSLAKYNTAEFTLQGNGKYAPLSPKYAEWKLKNYGVKPILVLTGALRDSLISPAGNKDSILNITNLTMERGTKLPYAGNVQEGTKNMPARPYYFLDEPRQKIIMDIINAGIARRVDELNQGV